MAHDAQKRKFIRAKATVLVAHNKFALPGLNPAAVQESMSLDVSAGGVCFQSKQGYAVGDILKVTLFLPQKEKGSYPVPLLGKVVRVSDPIEGKRDLGVAFVGINQAQQDDLNQFIIGQGTRL